MSFEDKENNSAAGNVIDHDDNNKMPSLEKVAPSFSHVL